MYEERVRRNEWRQWKDRLHVCACSLGVCVGERWRVSLRETATRSVLLAGARRSWTALADWIGALLGCTKVSKIIYTYRMREIFARAVKGVRGERGAKLWPVESLAVDKRLCEECGLMRERRFYAISIICPAELAFSERINNNNRYEGSTSPLRCRAADRVTGLRSKRGLEVLEFNETLLFH